MGQLPANVLKAQKEAAIREVEQLIAEWRRGNYVLPVDAITIYKGGPVYARLEKHGFLFRDMEPAADLSKFFPVDLNKKGIRIVSSKTDLPCSAEAKIKRRTLTLARLRCTVNAHGPYWNGFLS